MSDRSPKYRARVRALTARQRQVLELVAEGRTNAEIGEALGIGFETAKMHVGDILTRLSVSSREEAAAVWKAEHTAGARARNLFGFTALTPLKVAGFAAGGVFTMAGVIIAIALWQGVRLDRVSSDPGAVATETTTVALIGTRWDLAQIDGEPIPATLRQPNVIFRTDNYGSGAGGCNEFGGEFTRAGDVVTFTDGLIQTAMGCDGQEVEARFLAALSSGPLFLGQNGDSLSITASNGTELLFTARLVGDPGNHLLASRWVLREISGAAPAGFSAYIFLFAGDGTIVVTSPCGEIRGTYERAGVAMHIEVGGETPAHCAEPDRDYDQRLREALAATDSFIVDTPRAALSGGKSRIGLWSLEP